MATKKMVTARKAAKETKNDPVAHADDKSFFKLAGSGKLPVLVDFSSTSCGPCRQLAKVLPAIAEKYADRVKVVTADLDRCPRVAELFEVEAIPMLVLFKGGRALAVEEGFGTRRDTEAWLEKALRAAEKPARPKRRKASTTPKPRKPPGC